MVLLSLSKSYIQIVVYNFKSSFYTRLFYPRPLLFSPNFFTIYKMLKEIALVEKYPNKVYVFVVKLDCKMRNTTVWQSIPCQVECPYWRNK